MNIKTIPSTLLFVLLAACGGGSNEAAKPTDPSSTGEGKCSTTTTTSASDIDLCKAECEKLDDKAPAGTRCIPPRTSCKMACDRQFAK